MDRPFADIEEVLEHYGIKGMKWGVRRKNPTPTSVSVETTPGRRVKTSGGKGQSASDDAIRTAIARQKARKSTTDSLSNKELQDVVTRMNLEQQYERLRPKSTLESARNFIGKTLLGVGKEQAGNYARQSVSDAINNAKRA